MRLAATQEISSALARPLKETKTPEAIDTLRSDKSLRTIGLVITDVLLWFFQILTANAYRYRY